MRVGVLEVGLRLNRARIVRQFCAAPPGRDKIVRTARRPAARRGCRPARPGSLRVDALQICVCHGPLLRECLSHGGRSRANHTDSGRNPLCDHDLHTVAPRLLLKLEASCVSAREIHVRRIPSSATTGASPLHAPGRHRRRRVRLHARGEFPPVPGCQRRTGRSRRTRQSPRLATCRRDRMPTRRRETYSLVAILTGGRPAGSTGWTQARATSTAFDAAARLSALSYWSCRGAPRGVTTLPSHWGATHLSV